MFKKILYFFVFFCAFLPSGNTNQPLKKFAEIDPLDNMPIMEITPTNVLTGLPPNPQRGEEFRKFLAASVKIGVSGASGSGTIVYHDKEKNLAYVATCGHLWSPGIMSVTEGQKRKMKCKVIVWYHNDIKLDTPKTYPADVIFYSYVDGQDTALITFKPDWVPSYFPIAPTTYEYRKGQRAHSLGCDAGSEVAHYEIEIIGMFGADLVTFRNSPRPGRSGGGLMDDTGWYIGTCWGTQYRDGTGKGFFTPLKAIHNFWKKQEGYAFLLNQDLQMNAAKKIPILDKNNDQGNYDSDYILIPFSI